MNRMLDITLVVYKCSDWHYAFKRSLEINSDIDFEIKSYNFRDRRNDNKNVTLLQQLCLALVSSYLVNWQI